MTPPEPKSLPKKYCDNPDACTYLDCPTAFCDASSRTTPNTPIGEVDAIELATKIYRILGFNLIAIQSVQIEQAILEATKDLMEDKKRLDWYEKYRNCEFNFTISQDIDFYTNIKKHGIRTAISTAMGMKQ